MSSHPQGGDLNEQPTPEQRTRIRFDDVFIRCVVGFALAVTSLVMVVGDVKLSLLPLAAGVGLITLGKKIAGRHEPPITFLLMVPLIVTIVVVLVRRH